MGARPHPVLSTVPIWGAACRVPRALAGRPGSPNGAGGSFQGGASARAALPAACRALPGGHGKLRCGHGCQGVPELFARASCARIHWERRERGRGVAVPGERGEGEAARPSKSSGVVAPGGAGGVPLLQRGHRVSAELGDGAGSGRCRGAAAASRCGASASQRRLVINWQEQGVSARRLGCEDYRGRDFNRARIRSQRSLS